jgi:hypothetical protein
MVAPSLDVAAAGPRHGTEKTPISARQTGSRIEKNGSAIPAVRPHGRQIRQDRACNAVFFSRTEFGTGSAT